MYVKKFSSFAKYRPVHAFKTLTKLLNHESKSFYTNFGTRQRLETAFAPYPRSFVAES